MSADASPRAKTFALILLAATQFVVVLDASIVNVALPSIGADLDFSQDDLSWVVNAYVLVFGGFLLLGGPHGRPARTAADVHRGPDALRRGVLAGGLAQSDVMLIVARAVPGPRRRADLPRGARRS